MVIWSKSDDTEGQNFAFEKSGTVLNFDENEEDGGELDVYLENAYLENYPAVNRTTTL